MAVPSAIYMIEVTR